MKKETIHSTKARHAIQTIGNELLDLFLLCKSRNDELLKLKTEISTLDEENAEYHTMLHDARENMKMIFIFIVLILSFAVDFFLLYTGLDILSKQFGISSVFKFIVPIILIIIEVGISYFTTLQSREEDNSSLAKKLQYFVLLILVGFTLIVIFFHAQSYNAQIDKVSFFKFMTLTVIIQILLLISSLMLHLWLIRNAEDITEAIAYLRYKQKRTFLEKRKLKIENENSNIYHPRFTRLTHKFIKTINAFKRMYPDSNIDFSAELPQELIDGINLVMGKKVISSDYEKMEGIHKA
jgi:uncharacterized membrane protein